MSAQPLDSLDSAPHSPLSPPPQTCASPTASPSYDTDNAVASPPSSPLQELNSTNSHSELSKLIEADLFVRAAQKVTGGTDELLGDDQVQALADAQTEAVLKERVPAQVKHKMDQLEQEIEFCNEAISSGVKVRSV